MKIDPPVRTNRLLQRLPQSTLSRLEAHWRTLDLEVGDVLYEARQAIEYAYFPISGTLSAVVVMLDGSSIEAATVGNEGATGVPATSGLKSASPNRVFCQVPGAAIRIELEALLQVIRDDLPLKTLLETYQAAFLFQVSQSVACNGLHSLLKRCCRWLLMTHDRVQGDEIALTHEILAVMLGVRRPGVTETLQILKNSGYIDYGRGRVIVTNRAGLEKESCECYQAVRNEYERLLG